MRQPYIIISATNENGLWEADIFGSVDGRTPSTESYHVIVGEVPLVDDPRRMTVGPMLTAVGWAIEDQLRIGEDFIADQAEGARELIRNSQDDTEFVVRIDAGITKDQAIERLTFGGESRARMTYLDQRRELAIA